MTDKDEFSFEEETFPGEEGDSGSFAEEQLRESLSASAIEKEKTGSPRRLLLLVLLLVVIAAAAWFFYLGEPEAPPQPAPVATEKQPISVPVPPPPAKEAAPAPATAAPPQVQEPQPEKPVVEEMMPREKPAPAAIELPPVETEQTMAAPAGAYTVEAGAFLRRGNLAEAEKKVREIGFEPRVVQKEKPVRMTRLRIGIFPPEEGQNKVKELATLAPDAFYVRQGEDLAVYAGSFHDLDTARLFADRLYEQGIRVEEEPVQVEIPLFLLSFGDFADLAEAREAGAKATAAGLEVLVVKKH